MVARLFTWPSFSQSPHRETSQNLAQSCQNKALNMRPLNFRRKVLTDWVSFQRKFRGRMRGASFWQDFSRSCEVSRCCYWLRDVTWTNSLSSRNSPPSWNFVKSCRVLQSLLCLVVWSQMLTRSMLWLVEGGLMNSQKSKRSSALSVFRNHTQRCCVCVGTNGTTFRALGVVVRPKPPKMSWWHFRAPKKSSRHFRGHKMSSRLFRDPLKSEQLFRDPKISWPHFRDHEMSSRHFRAPKKSSRYFRAPKISSRLFRAPFWLFRVPKKSRRLFRGFWSYNNLKSWSLGVVVRQKHPKKSWRHFRDTKKSCRLFRVPKISRRLFRAP